MWHCARGLLRTFLLVFSVVAVLLAAAPVRAASFDPSVDWKTIKTPHFRIRFPERIEPIAQKSANILEEVFPLVTEKWGRKPWSYTEVVLTDRTDDSNGMAAVLPYNWMIIYTVPPSPDSSLAHYDDWLRMLLVHEFTHIVQIDAFGGIWWPVRVLLGKTVSPSGISPTWLREGIAQWDETVFTKGGRGRGSYSEMAIRTAILSDSFPPISFADGLSWKWPGYAAAYLYGIEFVEWLISTYGEDRFMEFDGRVRRSIMLAMINHQARQVYGKTFYELWMEWKRHLLKRFAAVDAALTAEGVTPAETLVPVKEQRRYWSPTLSRDGRELVYTQTSPFGPPEMHLYNIETGEDERIKKKVAANQFSFSPDGRTIAYSKMGGYKRYYKFYDLWIYDRDAKKRKQRFRRLTVGQRARDPDFTPDGKNLIFVKGDGSTDTLNRIDVKTRDVTLLTPNVAPHTQFANPRVSPCGRFIVVSMWQPDHGWRIYRLNIDGTNPVRLTKTRGLVIEAHPVWAPDGNDVIYSSDETGISNFYRVSAHGERKPCRITNVVSGAFQPTTAVGAGIVGEYYTPDGLVIARFGTWVRPADHDLERCKGKAVGDAGLGLYGGSGSTYPKHFQLGDDSRPTGGGKGVPDPAGIGTASLGATGFKKYPVEKYVAFGQSLFLPRFVLPNVAYTSDTVFASIMTGGADVLRWHNWLASLNYRVDARHLGYSLQYWYSRYRPVFSVILADYAVDFGMISFVNSVTPTLSRTVHFYEKRRAVAASVGVPWGSHGFQVAYFFEDHMPKTKLTAAERAVLNLGHFAGLRFKYNYRDTERYPASISRENGRDIRLTTIVQNKYFGSGDRNEQVIFSGDWREFIKLPWMTVFALRAAGGMTWGDRLVQGTFGMGGALGEGNFGGGGTYNYFPLRGLPVSALSRTRAMLFSGEYRFPLVEPQFGLGTAPFFLKDISAAVFADYGNAWNAHEGGCDSLNTFFDEFLLGVGAELRGNFIVGHGLPIHGRIGYAIIVLNRGRVAALTDPIFGQSIKDGIFILTLGAAF